MLKRKPINEPIISQFKGKKLVKESNIKSNHLYTYVNRSQKEVPTRDKTPVKSVTPRKKPAANKPVTPTKTAQKKPNFHLSGQFSQRA